jgi:WD40 repeat protein
MPSAEARSATYDLFMSYSHGTDSQLAPVLQRLVRRVGRPWFRRATLRVFRDDTGLTMNEDLWASIRSALDAARYFVLMASPQAARSAWVQREVEHWLETHDVGSVLIVLTEGDIRWNRDDGDFDASATTALPRGLFGRYANEPLWEDVRTVRTLVRRGQRNDRLRDTARSIAATLYGLPKDQLDSEDERESRRARRFLQGSITGLVLLTILSVVAAVVAIGARNNATAQLRIATARAVAGEADNLATREPALSAQLALVAHGLDPSPQTTSALMRSFERNRHVLGYLERSPGTTDGVDPATGNDYANGVALSTDGRTVAVAPRENADVRLWDRSARRLLRTLKTDLPSDGNQPPRMAFTDDGRLVVKYVARIDVWDVATGQRTISRALDSGSFVAVSPDARYAAVVTTDPHGRLTTGGVLDLDEPGSQPRQVATGAQSATLATQAVHQRALESIYPDPDKIYQGEITPNGKRAAILLDYRIVELWDMDARARLATWALPGNAGWVSIGLSGDGSTIAVGNDLGELIGLDSTQAAIEPLGELPAGIHELAFGTSGDVLTAVDDAGAVAVLSPHRDRRLEVLPGVVGATVFGEPEQPNLVASPDGRWLAAERVKSVQLWDVEQRRLVGEYPLAHSESSRFSADGRRFATILDDRVVIREVPSGTVVDEVPTAQDLDFARALQRGLGGVQIVRSTSAQTQSVVAVWASGEQTLDATTASTDTLVTTSIGASIAVSRPGPLESHRADVTSYELRGDSPAKIGQRTISGDLDVQAVSDDGRKLVLNGSVVDLMSGERTPLGGGNGLFSEMHSVLSADGGLLVRDIKPTREATGTIRNSLLVWDTTAGVLLGQWPETMPMQPNSQPYESTQVVRVGPDRVATVRADGSIALWTVAPASWVTQLCDMAGELDDATRSSYLGSVRAHAACTG